MKKNVLLKDGNNIILPVTTAENVRGLSDLCVDKADYNWLLGYVEALYTQQGMSLAYALDENGNIIHISGEDEEGNPTTVIYNENNEG